MMLYMIFLVWLRTNPNPILIHRKLIGFEAILETKLLTDPDLGLHEPVPLGCEEEVEAVGCAIQGYSFHTQDGQNHVREYGAKPQDLKDTPSLLDLAGTHIHF